MLSKVIHWLWLTTALEIGPAWQVLSHFSSPEEAYFADEREYDLIEKLLPRHRAALKDKSLAPAEAILARCEAQHLRILTWQDADYPERLRNIDLPPLVLYVRGSLPHLDETPAIAMAGTRRASPYGIQMARSLAFQITREGGLVITGIVAGCDENAVLGALKAGGPVVCVTAGGVDVPYYDSRRSRELLEDVAARGAVISEAPPGTAHRGALFARRNAVLTGLSVGVLCVEAGIPSGTLQVARLAIDQSRDVFAIPANVGLASSAGTNDLLRQGLATPVLTGSDVLEGYWCRFPTRQKTAAPLAPEELSQRLNSAPQAPSSGPSHGKSLSSRPAATSSKWVDREDGSVYIDLEAPGIPYSDDEKAILAAFSGQDRSSDELICATGLSAARAASTLTLLILRDLVEELPNGRFRCKAVIGRAPH